MGRIWVLALNDGEAVAIRDLLEECEERVLVSNQRWGASWKGLEPEITDELRKGRWETIYGIELRGNPPFPAHNIDHHRYDDEDRRNPLSSLEQVAGLLGVELNRHQQLVAANDRGYIPAMLALGATEEEVGEIRRMDRRAQGITAEQEREAEAEVAAGVWDGKRVEVACSRGVTAAHTDLLHGRAEESLLKSPSTWEYYGPRHEEFMEAGFAEEKWSGGSRESGYFGVSQPGAETRERMLGLFRRRG